jgi:N-methylhydantoinase B
MEAIVDSTEEKLRRRLRRIPDGVWRHRAYMDALPGTMFDIALEMRKSGDTVTFDFTGTSPQAPAVFNTSRVGTIGGIVAAMLPMLCYGMYSCPAAVRRVMDIVTEPGTLVDATWPAGMCKASTAAIPMVNTMTTVTLGKMLATADDDEMASRAMAPWMVAATVQDFFGDDRYGRPFGATMLDPMAGGGGAKADEDGIDGGGIIRAVKLRTANAETYEFRYPLLYLHRRLEPDTGGAGTFRGGVGCSLLFTLHGVDELPGNVMHSINTQAPTSVGILGGYPAGTNSMAMVRATNVWDEIGAGRWPTELGEIEGTLEVVPGMLASTFGHGDVYRSITCGGGGVGDPLEREPARVALDVARRAVSREEASRVYGVELDDDGAVDAEGTEARRAAIVDERLATAAQPANPIDRTANAAKPRRVGGALYLWADGGKQHLGCRCGRLFAPLAESYKRGLAIQEEPIQAAGPTANPYHVGQEFVFRRCFCPGCGRLVEIEVARPHEPLLHDVDLTSLVTPQERDSKKENAWLT